ncbi:MAG: restriction endonuclease subunit S [Candidatus Fermentibacteria bacterium]|nr:restriction endonuclease subunit S [Candidatus Fermentibacteria bacterium]
MQHAKGAKMPRGSKAAILNYQIPIPPLNIQKEIVKILDNFTWLEAELEARKKQHEHYREELLTFKPLEDK